jgi:hypothetical protein
MESPPEDATPLRSAVFAGLNSSGHFAIAMMVELPPMHRLNRPVVIDAKSFRRLA